MPRLPDVIGIFGPTASGKTAVAESLASSLGTEVVSADAMQVYRGLAILTDQPAGPTRLVAIRDLWEEMSVAEYAPLAHAAVDELVATHGTAIVAGGTGLYFRAALAELAVPPAPSAVARERWQRAYDDNPAALYAQLGRLDPPAAAVVHQNDRRRVVRALELAEVGSSLVPDHDRLWAPDTRRPTCVVGLEVPREVLEERIRDRAQQMVRRGVVEEVRRVVERPVSRTAEKALGLRELSELSLDQALQKLVTRTIRYSSYQRKWMRRIPGIVMINANRPAELVVDAILDVAHAR